MARKTNLRELAPVLDAAKHWIDRCLIGDESLFTDEVLWTEENAAELQRYFVENPDESSGPSFLAKLASQIAGASPSARQLMAEIFWAIRLFPTTPHPPTKREQFLQVWRLCGRADLSERHPMLSVAALGGIGSAGTAYLTGTWREINFLIRLLQQLKPLPFIQREDLFSANEKLSPWLEALMERGERQFPHILRYFAFPDSVERISSGLEKKKILKGFSVPHSKSWSALQVDQALLELRRKQETEHSGENLDFYEAPLRDKWKIPDSNTEGSSEVIAPTPAANYFAEETAPAPAQSETSAVRAINRIYFGPPGTGKTHRMKEIQAQYMETPEAKNRQAWLEALVTDYSWREVIAAALGSGKKKAGIVPEIREHELVQAKARQRKADRNLSARLWGTLQRHTPETVKTVNFGLRTEPFLFAKDESSVWSLLPEWQRQDEEAARLAGIYQQGPKAAPPIKRYRTITFHPSYCYEDFVRGIRPVVTEDEGRSEFRLVDGVFKQICDEARSSPQKRYALFIDEINRGSIAKIFGELITLIEPDKRITVATDGTIIGGITVQLPGGNTSEVAEAPFGVPANLDIYGTMNTADRSTALLDIALRRRFEFLEMPPRYDTTVFPSPLDVVDCGALLRRINDRLEYLLDRDHRIGHAYFMKAKDIADLRAAFANQIIPLLQEYFFEDFSKVALTLSGPKGISAFVQKEELSQEKLFAMRVGSGTGSRFRYVVTDQTQWTAESFQAIYASSAAPVDAVPEDETG